MLRAYDLLITAALTTGASMMALTSTAFAIDDEIRNDCEYQIQAYGITDAAEYDAALNDCIQQSQDFVSDYTPNADSEQPSAPEE